MLAVRRTAAGETPQTGASCRRPNPQHHIMIAHLGPLFMPYEVIPHRHLFLLGKQNTTRDLEQLSHANVKTTAPAAPVSQSKTSSKSLLFCLTSSPVMKSAVEQARYSSLVTEKGIAHLEQQEKADPAR